VEIDEIAARLLRQYWALVLFCVLAPLVVIALTVAKQPPMYAASARIVSGNTVPASNAQAQALVSQIQGVATGRTTAANALAKAHVTRNLSNFVTSHVSVSGLGGSQVVDLTVTDRDPRAAATLAKELAQQVVQSINRTGQSGLSTTLNAIDQEIVRLSEQHGVAASQAAAAPKNEQLQSKLAGLNQVIANFSGDRSRLLIQASTQGLASVLDQPQVPQQSQSKALAQKLGRAAGLGLFVGILIAAIAETIRPTVPGARRVSRRLGTTVVDTTSGFRAFSREALVRFADSYPSAYLSDTVEALLLAGDWGLTVVEVPVRMHARMGGTASSGSLKSAFHLLRINLVLSLHRVRRPL